MTLHEESINPETGSHRAINFTSISRVTGPLWNFNEMRPVLLAEVVDRTLEGVDHLNLEILLEETLFLEQLRTKKVLKQLFSSPFIQPRNYRDRALIQDVRVGLKRCVSESERRELLRRFATHFAEEIGGRFSSAVYEFSIRLVPWGFSWLLNAASVKRFLPWAMTESLQSRLKIVGEVPHLQKLAQKGTILLVPTHQSNIDSVLIGYVIYLMSLPPFAYGAGLNLFSNPLLSFFMESLGAYTVDRQKTGILYKETLKNYSTCILENKIHSIFFPGGGRSRSGAIENHLKLGLLGTAVQAQIENYLRNDEKPNIYVVPMVTSYHFVLEATSLIENYLEQRGRHRYMPNDSEEGWPLLSGLKFFWKFFSVETEISVRIGKPLDVFGNFVDEEGRSIGPNGGEIDPKKWFTTRGVLQVDQQRDHEYTRQLGMALSSRYHQENTVLSSHLVAFTLFQVLRKQYFDLDLYQFLRLSLPQRTVTEEKFFQEAHECQKRVIEAAHRGELYLSESVQSEDVVSWVDDGIRQLGLFHGSAVVKRSDQTVFTEDMQLLYYYRNRLTGYGLGRIESDGQSKNWVGEFDEKGFLV